MLSIYLDAIVSICGIAISVTTFFIVDHLPCLPIAALTPHQSNNSAGGIVFEQADRDTPSLTLSQTSQTASGKLIRNWFLLTLGLAGLLQFICEAALVILTTLTVSSTLTELDPKPALFLALRYVPSVAFLSFQSLAAFYIYELSQSTGDIKIAVVVTHWQLWSLAVLLAFLLTNLVPALRFLLSWVLLAVFALVLVVTGWSTRALLQRLPRQSSMSGRQSNALSSRLYQRLLPLTAACGAAAAVNVVYQALQVAGLDVLAREDLYAGDTAVWVDFARTSLSQTALAVVILQTMAKSTSGSAATNTPAPGSWRPLEHLCHCWSSLLSRAWGRAGYQTLPLVGDNVSGRSPSGLSLNLSMGAGRTPYYGAVSLSSGGALNGSGSVGGSRSLTQSPKGMASSRQPFS